MHPYMCLCTPERIAVNAYLSTHSFRTSSLHTSSAVFSLFCAGSSSSLAANVWWTRNAVIMYYNVPEIKSVVELLRGVVSMSTSKFKIPVPDSAFVAFECFWYTCLVLSVSKQALNGYSTICFNEFISVCSSSTFSIAYGQYTKFEILSCIFFPNFVHPVCVVKNHISYLLLSFWTAWTLENRIPQRMFFHSLMFPRQRCTNFRKQDSLLKIPDRVFSPLSFP